MGVIDARISVFDPTGQTLLCNDASADLYGGIIQYEDTPSGCGAGKLTHGLRYEELFQRGYYTALNIFEISSGDNVLMRASAAGASKFYIDTTWSLDPAQGEDVQQLYFFDGYTLTMRVPVTGIGSDANGSFVTTGAPDGRNGNPSTMPAYAPGTIVGRRRYAGRVMGSSITDGRDRGGDITLKGLSDAWAGANGTFTITTAANIDCSVALFESLNQFYSDTPSRWPFFRAFTQAQFPTVGSIYAGSLTTVGCDRFISDVLSSIASADQWFVRVGHDLIPRLVKLYTQSTNGYTYGVTLLTGSGNFEPVNFEIDDQDASTLYNSIRVTGDTDPVTKQPVIAQVTDPTSIALYGIQIDADPASNTAIKTATAAAGYGLGLVLQNSLARSQQSFDVITANDNLYGTTPGGMTNGDVVRGVDSVTIAGVDATWMQPNFVPDSEIQVPENWTLSGGTSVFTRIASSTIGRYEWSAAQAIQGSNAYAFVGPVAVAPGSKFVLSGFIDAPTLTGAARPTWTVQSYPANAVLATATGASNASGTYASPAFTIPAGVSAIIIVAHLNDASWSSGAVHFGAPMLSLGTAAAAYSPNYAAPNQYGLVQSAVTTIDFSKYMSSQKVSFSAIEPDWRAAIAEKANALATALRQNTVTPVSLSGYCVSPEAQDYAYGTSGLTVTTTAFEATYAHGSATVTVPASSFTLPARATSWVWLEPGNTWSIQTGPVAVPGAILLAIFQTSATQILGDYFRAAIGTFFETGAPYSDPSLLFPAPTFGSGTSVVSGASDNGIAADLDVVLNLTNVPTDNSANMVQFYWRVTATGGGAVKAWIPEDGINLVWSGTAVEGPNQTIDFSYGNMVKGATYDLGVAYRGPSGYGQIAVFAQACPAQLIAIGAPYMLGGTPVTPTFSGVSVANGPSANNITANVTVALTTTNQPTDTSLWRVNFWTRLSSQNNDGTAGSSTPGNAACLWAPQDGLQAVGAGSTSPPTSGAYTTALSNIPGGQSIDVGMSFENTQRGQSNIGVVIENFATVVVAITPDQTTFSNIINSQFNGLEIGANGFLGMLGARQIYPSQLVESINITQPPGIWNGQVQIEPGSSTPLDFKMRFQMTASAQTVGLNLFTNAAPTASTLTSGYQLQYGLNTNTGAGELLLFKFVAGSGYLQIAAASAAFTPTASQSLSAAVPAVPPPDEGWHTLRIIAMQNPISYGSPGRPISGGVGGPGIWFLVQLDGVSYIGVGVNFAFDPAGGNGQNHSAPLVSGSCGPYAGGAVSASAPILIDPTTFSIASNQGVYTELSAKANAAAIKSDAQVATNTDADSSALQSKTVSRRHSDGTTGEGENLVFNPTAAINTSGWTTFGDAGLGTNFTRDGYNGGRFIVGNAGGVAPDDALYLQTLNATGAAGLFAGFAYTVSGYIEAETNASGNAPGTALVDIAQVIDSTSIGSSPQIAIGTGQVFFSFTFVMPSGTAVWLRLRTTGGAVNGYFYKLVVNEGTPAIPFADHTSAGLVTTTHTPAAGADGSNMRSGLMSARHFYGGNAADSGAMVDESSDLLYARHAPVVRGVITASGTIPISTALNSQGSINGYADNAIAWTSTTDSSNNVTITWTWPNFNIGFTDGSSMPIAANSVTYPTSQGFKGGQTWYWVASYNFANGQSTYVRFGAYSSLTAANYLARVQAVNTDGNVPVAIGVATTFPAYQTSSGSGGTGGGGGGGGSYCPAAHQLIETRERGFVRADSLVVGEHLRDYYPGRWNRISVVRVRPGWIADVTIGDELLCVEIDHLWLRADGDPDEDADSNDWVATKDLTLNTVIAGEGGKHILPVRAIGNVRLDRFAAITCANHRFMLGRACGHNIITM